MAVLVLVDPFVSINAVDLSEYVKRVTLNLDAAELDQTAGGDTTQRALAGLKKWTASIEFNQDFALTKVDATLFPLWGAAAFAVEFRPVKTGGRSTTNPGYTGNAVLTKYSPLGQGQHGQLVMAPADVVSAGALSRVTA